MCKPTLGPDPGFRGFVKTFRGPHSMRPETDTLERCCLTEAMKYVFQPLGL